MSNSLKKAIEIVNFIALHQGDLRQIDIINELKMKKVPEVWNLNEEIDYLNPYYSYRISEIKKTNVNYTNHQSRASKSSENLWCASSLTLKTKASGPFCSSTIKHPLSLIREKYCLIFSAAWRFSTL